MRGPLQKHTQEETLPECHICSNGSFLHNSPPGFAELFSNKLGNIVKKQTVFGRTDMGNSQGIYVRERLAVPMMK